MYHWFCDQRQKPMPVTRASTNAMIRGTSQNARPCDSCAACAGTALARRNIRRDLGDLAGVVGGVAGWSGGDLTGRGAEQPTP